MPRSIFHEEAAGPVVYRLAGEVSDANDVTLEMTMTDADGQMHPLGRLTIPLARVKRFQQVLNQVLRGVAGTPPVKAYTLAELRERENAPSSHLPWTAEEEAQLVNEFNEGISEEEIARHHGRRPGAIRARLVKLGKLDDWHVPIHSDGQ